MDLMIFEAELLSIKFKRFICRHRYYVIADNKFADAGLWKCEKCGDLMFQHRKVDIRKQHYNDRVNVEEWTEINYKAKQYDKMTKEADLW